jgi:hypothetical protein
MKKKSWRGTGGARKEGDCGACIQHTHHLPRRATQNNPSTAPRKKQLDWFGGTAYLQGAVMHFTNFKLFSF